MLFRLKGVLMSHVKEVHKRRFPHPKSFQTILLLCLLAGLALLLSAQPGLADPPPPAAASILTTVDSGDVGRFTSPALDSSGNPVISY